MKLFFKLMLSIFFLLAVGCQSSTPEPEEEKMPLDLKWMRYSVEYQALCTQVYRLAWQSVKRQAATLDEDWVVVLDVDETALDNSGYQEILYKEKKDFPYFWDDWVLLEECPPVPGVKAFIDSVRSLGDNAHIAFITNRNFPLTDATRSNLTAVGLWEDGDVLLCQKGRPDTKGIRRDEVRNGTGRCEGMGPRKIIALIGDQIGDMDSYPEEKPSEEPTLQGTREEHLKEYYLNSDKWGTAYFMLPNPMYGYWTSGYQR